MTCSRLLAVAVAAALIIPAAAMAETIEGVVDFTGKAPTPGKLHREADPFCAKKPMTDPSVLVNSGKLVGMGGDDALDAELAVARPVHRLAPRRPVGQVLVAGRVEREVDRYRRSERRLRQLGGVTLVPLEVEVIHPRLDVGDTRPDARRRW